jgi:hypothetical protein
MTAIKAMSKDITDTWPDPTNLPSIAICDIRKWLEMVATAEEMWGNILPPSILQCRTEYLSALGE